MGEGTRMDLNEAAADIATLSAFGKASQLHRLLRLDFPFDDGPAKGTLLVNTMHAREELSRDFCIDLELLSDSAFIPLNAMMAKMVTVSLVRADGSLRYFNGYVNQFELIKTDGGFAFYRMVLGPWLAFARLREDCVSFQRKSIVELTETTFGHYPERDYRFGLTDDAAPLSCANQYNETDYNHLHRRWEALGLHYMYEHRADGHTLCLADNTAFAPWIDMGKEGGTGEMVFRSESGAIEGDGIDSWQPARRIGGSALTLTSFDYKKPRPQREQGHSLNRQDNVASYERFRNLGAYGFRDRAGGEAMATRGMQELDAMTQFFRAAGNDRNAQAGRSFQLLGHFSSEPPRMALAERAYLILAVDHHASNNYQAGPGTPSNYTNEMTCIGQDVRWRPGRGHNSAPCSDPGVQTALVVGPAGQQIHTDGLGRVKVQFHWDRAGQYDDASSQWVRVAMPVAGGQSGQIGIPRIGQEVMVQFLDGNVDHPIITGIVYNSENMPPWQLPGQAALSGLRSRELGGGGRSNHLVLDDTAGKIQAQLKSDHLASQLSLGHISRIEDNAGRKDARGQGFELRTDGHGAVRAQHGLLLSTEGRPNAGAHITDMAPTLARLAQGQELHDSLSQVAQQALAHQPGDQDQVAAALQAQVDALKGTGGQAAQGEFPEFQAPHLTLASPAGIETTTQGSTHLMSVEHTALSSGGHASLSAGKSLLVSVKEAVRMFAYKAGMKLVAASADIDITALKDSVNILAKLNITHTANRITITAKEEVVINGGSSFSRWNASGIVHGTSGSWRQHAAQHSFVPAKSEGTAMLPQPVQLPPGQLNLYHQYVNMEGATKQGIKQGDYTVVDAEGGVHQGKLDDKGFASVAGLPMGMATVSYGKDPRDPWDEASYFGQESEWPAVAQSGTDATAAVATDPTCGRPDGAPIAQKAGQLPSAKAAAATTKGERDKFGALAQAAQQAASAVQSLPKGGAQALLAPLAQTALGKPAGMLPGATTALNVIGAANDSKPAAAIASALGLPGSLPRISAEVPPSPLKKSVS
jgi:type VI secretion system secreted protein VgrG